MPSNGWCCHGGVATECRHCEARMTGSGLVGRRAGANCMADRQPSGRQHRRRAACQSAIEGLHRCLGALESLDGRAALGHGTRRKART
ncbi:hypothetical protein NDU88_000461 [Pleurodeles waltl]|uniref:Uncharacterized protein n=1 Tax=Pleurodeles waltl TaxID=8319 RepID=A0AAV7L6N2_PLEWA|nr:hypothetical protein NDU88_000461 [Pleurodeles waltl]